VLKPLIWTVLRDRSASCQRYPIRPIELLRSHLRCRAMNAFGLGSTMLAGDLSGTSSISGLTVAFTKYSGMDVMIRAKGSVRVCTSVR